MKIKSLLILPVIVCTAYTCFEIYKKTVKKVEKLKGDKAKIESDIKRLYSWEEYNVKKFYNMFSKNEIFINDLYKQLKFDKPTIPYEYQ